MSRSFRGMSKRQWSSIFVLVAGIVFSGGTSWAVEGLDPLWAGRLERILNAERSTAGSPSFERRAVLDDLAGEMAASLAAKPPKKRLALSRSLESWLERNEIPFRRAYHFAYLSKGANDPLQDLVDRWQDQRRRWRKVMDRKMHAAGFGAARTEDGWLILVAIVLRDPPAARSAEIAKTTQQELWTLERLVHERVNRIRLEYGFSHLAWDDELSHTARNHSTDMAVRGYFGHEDPEGRGLGVRLAGLEVEEAAENIAASENVEQPMENAIRAWLGSPDHRANLLGEDFTRTGVGVAVDRRGKYYFTQVFARFAADD